MKYGEPFYIRISTRDILTLLDVLEKRGIVIYNRSLAEAMSNGVKTLCEAARVAGLVPSPDESQYAERTAQYRRNKVSGVTETELRGLGFHRIGPKALELARAKIARVPVGQPEPGEPMTHREKERMQFLAHKRSKVPLEEWPQFMETEEGRELDRLLSKTG